MNCNTLWIYETQLKQLQDIQWTKFSNERCEKITELKQTIKNIREQMYLNSFKGASNESNI